MIRILKVHLKLYQKSIRFGKGKPKYNAVQARNIFHTDMVYIQAARNLANQNEISVKK